MVTVPVTVFTELDEMKGVDKTAVLVGVFDERKEPTGVEAEVSPLVEAGGSKGLEVAVLEV